MPDPTCLECGYSIFSAEHQRGVGPDGEPLHGHVSTTVEEADEQRADVLARAEAFAAEAQAAETVNAADLVATNGRRDDRIRELEAQIAAATPAPATTDELLCGVEGCERNEPGKGYSRKQDLDRHMESKHGAT